jgi:O-succinylbenzoic acid--CoA ligase
MQHFESAVGVNERMEFDSSQRWLMSLPLYHVGGLAIVVRSLLANASLALPCENQSLKETLQVHSPTHISLVAAQLKQLIADGNSRNTLSQCRRIILGGGPVPSWIDEDASVQKLPLVASYGATEMASMWTATNLGAGKISSQGSGTLLDKREIRIADDGEIRVKGPMLFHKYLGGPNLAAFDDDGFYRSGDLGSLDAQENLHILGRRDNMFVSGGENIHPQEIELALLNHPSIVDAIVVNVPNSNWGERPVAFVRYAATHSQDAEDLGKFLRTTLPGFKIPDRFFDWPHEEAAILKPSRQRLRQKALALL